MLSSAKQSYIFGFGLINTTEFCIVDISLSEANIVTAESGGKGVADASVLEIFYR